VSKLTAGPSKDRITACMVEEQTERVAEGDRGCSK